MKMLWRFYQNHFKSWAHVCFDQMAAMGRAIGFSQHHAKSYPCRRLAGCAGRCLGPWQVSREFFQTISRTLSSMAVAIIFFRFGSPRAKAFAKCNACFAFVLGGMGGSNGSTTASMI